MTRYFATRRHWIKKKSCITDKAKVSHLLPKKIKNQIHCYIFCTSDFSKFISEN